MVEREGEMRVGLFGDKEIIGEDSLSPELKKWDRTGITPNPNLFGLLSPKKMRRSKDFHSLSKEPQPFDNHESRKGEER